MSQGYASNGIEFQATTDVNNTEISCRFSLIEVRDVDAV